MKTFFKRTMQQSYMVIEGELYTGYDKKLLSRCEIDFFLSTEALVENEKLQFWYKIGGLQMLDSYLSDREITVDWLKSLIFQIEHMLASAEKYLLLEDSIVLSPDKIGICVETGEFYFCYLPGYQVDVKKQFQKLMEELLTKVDHKDKQAVDAAYAIYEMSLQENYCFEEMKKVFLCEKEEEKEEEEQETEIWEEEKVINAELPKEKSMKEMIGQKLQQLFERKGMKEPESMQVAFEPDEKEEIGMVSNPTVLLQSFGEIIGKLNYNGRNAEQDFLLTEDSFVFGTKEGSVDGILHSKAVSRMHARIRKEGTDYFLEDLNSKNGTWLNGELLDYKTKYPLKKNDKICFADEEYIFS